MKHVIFLLFVCLLYFSEAYSQACIPEWTQPGSGIYPDTFINMPDGAINVPYDITVQFKVPLKDSSVIASGIDVNRVVLKSVNGLGAIPSSVPFHYNCNPSNCTFKADSVGCVRIQGTASATGVFPLSITAEVYFTQVLFIPVDFTGYKIEIGTTIDAPILQPGVFSVSQNTPNPAKHFTQISFNLAKSAPVTIKIANVIGNEVYSNSVAGKSGLNTISVNVSNFEPGMYFYTIRDSELVVTKRMIVDR